MDTGPRLRHYVSDGNDEGSQPHLEVTMDCEVLCQRVDAVDDDSFETSLIAFYNECTRSAFDLLPVSLRGVRKRQRGERDLALTLTYVVEDSLGIDAWDIYAQDPAMLDGMRTYINDRFEGELAFEYIETTIGSCGVEVGVAALAMKWGPVVSAGCAIVNVGLTIWGKFTGKVDRPSRMSTPRGKNKKTSTPRGKTKKISTPRGKDK